MKPEFLIPLESTKRNKGTAEVGEDRDSDSPRTIASTADDLFGEGQFPIKNSFYF